MYFRSGWPVNGHLYKWTLARLVIAQMSSGAMFSVYYTGSQIERNAINLNTGNKLTSGWWQLFNAVLPRSKALENPNEELKSERRNGERLYKVILNLGKLFRSSMLPFTKYAYLPRFAGIVSWLFSLIARCSSKTIVMFMKLKSRCTFAVSVVLLLIGVEKKTWSICRFYDRGNRRPSGLLILIVLRPLRASGPTHLY